MSDAVIVIKDPNEELKSFNKRLRGHCSDTPVTDFEVHVVDGQPMVTLFSGMVEANEEDVAEAKEEGDTVELGEEIPEDDPVIVQVCGVAAMVPMEVDADGKPVSGKEGDAARSEKRLDLLCEKAHGNITKMRVATSTAHAWVAVPGKDANKREWLPVTKTYVGLAYINNHDAATAPAPAAEA